MNAPTVRAATTLANHISERVEPHRFCCRFLTSSSFVACSMILFGCPGVLPECPFDQSYETAYAKIVPVRLNAEAETGPGHCSKAVAHKQTRKAKSVGDSEKASG